MKNTANLALPSLLIRRYLGVTSCAFKFGREHTFENIHSEKEVL
jgi:hypothetical protein